MIRKGKGIFSKTGKTTSFLELCGPEILIIAVAAAAILVVVVKVVVVVVAVAAAVVEVVVVVVIVVVVSVVVAVVAVVVVVVVAIVDVVARTYKTKLVFTVRNPKDVAVSLYNHHINLKEIYNYHGEFHDWFPLFLDGDVDYGDYFTYHLNWATAIRDNPDHPILVLKYEDAKENFPDAIRKLADFIETSLTEDQVKEIAQSVNFDAAKKHLPSNKILRKG
ncbi:sulfotransferase family cytosolic 1B member 1 [Elysia marginata]|uniref:Sulfotransferase family cytosolic 1B member 1 n=1 Tax=Elysia marginata TaxID=1093978 RepID=A0AAV4IJD6_9GAST|nr:sulfotransferase family cytosolic 1B member 1 [Elysia marginata]